MTFWKIHFFELTINEFDLEFDSNPFVNENFTGFLYFTMDFKLYQNKKAHESNDLPAMEKMISSTEFNPAINIFFERIN